jgi:hypothetical protein
LRNSAELVKSEKARTLAVGQLEGAHFKNKQLDTISQLKNKLSTKTRELEMLQANCKLR